MLQKPDQGYKNLLCTGERTEFSDLAFHKTSLLSSCALSAITINQLQLLLDFFCQTTVSGTDSDEHRTVDPSADPPHLRKWDSCPLTGKNIVFQNQEPKIEFQLCQIFSTGLDQCLVSSWVVISSKGHPRKLEVSYILSLWVGSKASGSGRHVLYLPPAAAGWIHHSTGCRCCCASYCAFSIVRLLPNTAPYPMNVIEINGADTKLLFAMHSGGIVCKSLHVLHLIFTCKIPRNKRIKESWVPWWLNLPNHLHQELFAETFQQVHQPFLRSTRKTQIIRQQHSSFVWCLFAWNTFWCRSNRFLQLAGIHVTS